MLTLVLLLVPVLAIISALYLYQHTGKREILKFDLVQFAYAFVITPIVYIWFKSFLFVSLLPELNLHLSITDLFIADTIYSVIFLYVYAFIIIHSLTKSFELKRSRDPFYDIFQHAEFFHLLTSHAALYIGAGILFFIIATVNLFVPLHVASTVIIFYATLFIGLLFGFFVFLSLLLTDDDFEKKYPRFEMFVELFYAGIFIVDVGFYFWLKPAFNVEHGMYWFGIMTLVGFIMCSLLIERSQRTVKLLKKFHYKQAKRK